MVLAQAQSSAIVLVLTLLIILVNIAILVGFVGVIFAPWMRAFTSGTPVSVFDILGMRLRRTDVNAVVRSLIMARQAGVALSCRQVERACLQGVDIEKLTLAMIHAKRQGMELTFEQLVEADLDDRLAEKLKVPLVSGSTKGTAGATSLAAAAGEAPSARTCPKCSEQVSGDGKICRNCGAIL